ncbi:hypothetical protein HY642_02360 [Candidatus Woesearchaeota archaeon]|nr:hypothetical protein [Candidatus Woesearchaeota archaeon]
MKVMLGLALISLVLIAGCQTQAAPDESAEGGNGAAADASPCDPPAGTSAEDWREHMGHHPDQYKGCL